MTNATTAKQRVLASLNGEGAARPACGPLAVHYCARLAGVSCRDYTTDAAVLADCVVRYYETFEPDAVWISADTWVTAEAMGAAVAFPSGDVPLGGTGEPRVRCAADVDTIPAADPGSQGRMPLMLDALRRVRERLGDDVFVVGCLDQAPLTLAAALLGMEELMTKLYDDPPLVQALLERCAEYGTAYGAALAAAGADMLSAGDSVAGLVGPSFYESTARPAERALFARLRERTDVPLSLHICGDTTKILEQMGAAGADVVEIDHRVDIGEAAMRIPDEVAVWGNLDPVDLLARGTPADIKMSVTCTTDSVRAWGRDRFVLSSGCTLAPDTPLENLRAFFDAARGR